MESPSCTRTSRSISISSIPSRTGRSSFNENSLNAALAFQLQSSASSWYDSPRSEGDSRILRNGLVVPLQSHQIASRTHGRSNRNANHSESERSLSDILGEAINISNEILLRDSSNCSSDIIEQEQQHSQTTRKGKRRRKQTHQHGQ